ncbi:hypothetical protein ONZ43_g5550 [Nemania bipapillata]|uniref:Uncharacterized protein n=1 Tax=Nemania bipapillata TaxID=110536 RepID=A0ACC2I9B4_9PEZI|nr:hypothetical protein ONZ43_g5550 [Nemania bipapillata]
MNLTITHAHLDQFKVRIDWLRANKPEVPFVLDEVGNSLQPSNTYAYQARLGSALWQVDFYLYSMAIGVARINYQQIMHAGYNMWLPVTSAGLPAQVFSNYYSQPFVADFIVGTSNFAAYAAYEDGAPKRIAAVNLNYWNQTSSTGTRGSVTLDLEIPEGVEQLTVYHLNSPAGAGAAADTITYGGSQWTYDSLGKEVKNVRRDTETVPVVNGAASVSVTSSEAVLIWL